MKSRIVDTPDTNGAAEPDTKDALRLNERKAEAYDLIRLIEQAKLRLAEVNRAIAEVEK